MYGKIETNNVEYAKYFTLSKLDCAFEHYFVQIESKKLAKHKTFMNEWMNEASRCKTAMKRYRPLWFYIGKCVEKIMNFWNYFDEKVLDNAENIRNLVDDVQSVSSKSFYKFRLPGIGLISWKTMFLEGSRGLNVML